MSLNLHRRHLDESQRAMVAARLATLPAHRPAETASIDALTQTQAAELLNVSRPSVQRAREVIEDAPPAVVEAVERGDLSVSLQGAERQSVGLISCARLLIPSPEIKLQGSEKRIHRACTLSDLRIH